MPQPTEPSKPLARIEDGFLVLNDGAMWDYEISLDQLRSTDQRAHWLEHLGDKRWFSDGMKAHMLRLLGCTDGGLS